MDRKTSEALNAIEKIKAPSDVIYEISRKEKKSGWYVLVDMLFDNLLSTSNSLMKDKVMFLVASEKSGKIVEIENGSIRTTVEVPGWTSDKKENFTKVIIDNYVYKKFRKIT
jgi:hypothetical protein